MTNQSLFLALSILLFSSVANGRVKNIPNTARLELAAVREVVLPEGASEKLQAAVGDLQVVWAGCGCSSRS
jgi:hypothetical protein